jgi:peptide/nickel transport system permease protein
MASIPQSEVKRKRKPFSQTTLYRVGRYSVVRLITLFITVVIGIYLTIMIANMGGYVDTIMKSQIRETINASVAANPAYRGMSTEEKRTMADKMIGLQEKKLGLNQPFVVRTVKYLSNALTLKLGNAIIMVSDQGSKTVKNIILERLPATLLLIGTSDMILFFLSLVLALTLSRHYGSFWDKLVIGLSPTSAAPPWFYGIFLILIFAALLKILPFGGMIDAPIPTNPWLHALSILKHMILPMGAWLISQIFLSIYNYRTFFLIFSSEDYVDMAKAKGLPDRNIERRYILRPTLPIIITNFALLVIVMWQGAIITETVFVWPGLGRTIFTAIGQYDTPVIVGTTIIYAYLLAITVFLLDFVYALVDPRVKIGSGN